MVCTQTDEYLFIPPLIGFDIDSNSESLINLNKKQSKLEMTDYFSRTLSYSLSFTHLSEYYAS
jgi:hypothetical protein